MDLRGSIALALAQITRQEISIFCRHPDVGNDGVRMKSVKQFQRRSRRSGGIHVPSQRMIAANIANTMMNGRNS
jgi:hypothetical protein